MSRGLVYLLVAIIAIAAVGAGAAWVDRRNDARPAGAQGARTASTPRPQPGPAPAGKVWSAEHGHWHDAGPQPTKENPTTVNTRNVSPPPGPAPAGKVWSPEHGHWHDE